jgi:hypothetical protein
MGFRRQLTYNDVELGPHVHACNALLTAVISEAIVSTRAIDFIDTEAAAWHEKGLTEV